MKKTYITKDEELTLLCAWQTGRDEKAFKALLAAHDKFCRKIAYDFMNNKHDLSLDDLHQQGRIGLLIAADKFDLNSGNRFLSYAGSYIRGEIQNYIENNGHTVRHSVVTIRHVKNLERLREKFFVESGRYPCLEEISGLSGIKPKAAAKYSAMYVTSVSLDQPQQSLNSKPMVDFLEAENAPQPMTL